jgi:hypothetical protein
VPFFNIFSDEFVNTCRYEYNCLFCIQGANNFTKKPTLIFSTGYGLILINCLIINVVH